MTWPDSNVVDLAAKRPAPDDWSVEFYGAMRALARLSREERVGAFSFSCSETEMRALARVAARFIGPTILMSVAGGLSESEDCG